jgi:uncharacterized protein YyaL (SSP411 family)
MRTSEATTLEGTRSPFLRHGAEQPVNWMPWGDAAFERARQEDRPILLDIGAVWCHWCHVMDSESYDDVDTARIINDSFVPVKVDRDERPDVDARYQRAVQLLTGQGGWPLTAFLTPEGEVYYGGTYFPPDDRFGRPSFRRVLHEVARVWKDERERALDAARGIHARLEEYTNAEARGGELSPTLLADTLEELASSFDFRHGGFGRAPKFPNAGAIDLLLDHWIDTGTDWAKRIVLETLVAMGRGGIYDQLGGGFHRYATDARWLIPHFEKMAYDNGVLLETYARAHQVLHEPLLAEVGDGIVEHYRDLAPELLAAGGFPASQDADYGPGDDGDYWTWTQSEIETVLDDARLARAARLWFGLEDPGSAMHLDPSRHVLFRALDVHGLAERMNVDTATAQSMIAEIRGRLKAARERRPAPFIDETLYSGWVALVTAGHLAAARFLRRPDAAEAALTALARILREAFDPARGVAHRVGDPDSGEFLDDQAYVAVALLDAFELTQSGERLEEARAVVRVLWERFHDPESGGLRDRPRGAAAAAAVLEQPHLPIADAPSPSGNAMAALAMLRLAALTHEDVHETRGTAVLRAFAGSAPRLTSAAATYMKALSWATMPVTTVVVVDDVVTAESELFQAALAYYRPRSVLRYFQPDGIDSDTLPPELRSMVGAAFPRAYLCAGQTCAAPVTDAAALRDLLHSFRG